MNNIIRVTDMRIFKQCRQRFYYSHIQRLATKESLQDALFLGVGIHHVLENLYREKQNKITISSLADVWKNTMIRLGHTQVEESVKNMALSVLNHYQEFHEKADLNWEILSTENTAMYIVNTPNGPMEIRGTRDLIIKENGCTWIVDHKTYSRYPDPRVLELDEQITLYCWLHWKMGSPVEGVIINVLLKAMSDDIPVVYNGKGLSKNKNLLTTYDAYRRKIHEMGFEEKDYADYLQMLKEREERINPFCQRFYVRRTRKQLEIFEAEFMNQLADYQDMRIYRCPDLHCTYCPFHELCTTARDGGDVDYLIQEHYRVKQSFER